MKVEIKRLGGGPIRFDDFADRHGLVMEVRQRGARMGFDFYASFKNSETKDGGFLTSEYGTGATPEEAIGNYRDRLRGKLLVVDATKAGRREIQCPPEWLPSRASGGNAIDGQKSDSRPPG